MLTTRILPAGDSTQESINQVMNLLQPTQDQHPPPPPPPASFDNKIQTLPPPASPPPPPQPPVPQPSRRRHIDTGSHPLSGTYPLYDLLTLRTTSDALAATIHPHPIDPHAPAPATLQVSTHSGTIDVAMRGSSAVDAPPPPRDYDVALASHSGRITAHLLHGVRTEARTHSGAMELKLTCVGSTTTSTSSTSTAAAAGQSRSPSSSTITTQTHSAQQTVHVVAPPGLLLLGGGPLRSSHTTHSGQLTLRYPGEWEGTIEGSMWSAGVEIQGPDVEVVERTARAVRARKGRGSAGSVLEFRTWSGKVKIVFG